MDQGRVKFRIIGAAVVLIALAVLILLVVGRDRAPTPGNQEIALPAEPTQGLAGEIRADDSRPPPQLPELEDIPLPAPTPPADLLPPDEPPTSSAPAPVAPTIPPAGTKPPTAPATAKPAPTAPKPAPGAAERLGVQAFIVQVGSFTNPASAQQVHDKLKAAGFKVFTEKTQSAGQTSIRVRVGPEPDRVSAEQTRDRIAREQGLTGVVLRFQ